MENDPKIRSLFPDDNSHARPIDLDSVIRQSRNRRRPRQVAVGVISTLAVGGILLAGFQGLGALNSPTATIAGSAPEAGATDSGPSATEGTTLADPSAPTGAIKRAPADRINLCTGTLADVAPSESGLELSVHFDDAKATNSPVSGTVTMTNTGSKTLEGYTAASPAITLSQDGIVLWHSNGAMIASATIVDLAPGESLDYPASFTPVTCGVEDDLSDTGFREDLPVVDPGKYQLSAAIDFSGDFDADLVTGPLSTITLK